jgi:hypothetical protein
MMNPFRSGFYAVQLLSHKVLRYLVPLWLIVLIVSSAMLAPRSTFFALITLAQILFYLAGAAGWFLERAGMRGGPLALAQYFLLANVAAVIAFFKFLSGERYARWEPIREAAAGSGIGLKDSPQGN